MMHGIIIYPGHLSLDVVSQFIAIRDRRITMEGFRSDIQNRTTSYPHETSEEIINQDRPKYSVQVYKKTSTPLGTAGGTSGARRR